MGEASQHIEQIPIQVTRVIRAAQTLSPPQHPVVLFAPLKGVEESLAFLRKVWDEQGPFDGLLGFSQGAAMASLFNHCAFAGGARGGGGGSGGGGREEQLVGAGGDLAVSTSFFPRDFQGAKARTRVRAVQCRAMLAAVVPAYRSAPGGGRWPDKILGGRDDDGSEAKLYNTSSRACLSCLARLLWYGTRYEAFRVSSERSVSRPALAAFVLCLLQVFDMPLLPPPRFAVFISGCFQPHPTQVTSPCSQIGWWCPCSTEFTGD